jgi:hypothetical protein
MYAEDAWIHLRTSDLKAGLSCQALVTTDIADVHVQAFPFALVSINLSKWAIDALVGGKLNGVAIKRSSMIEACNLFHVGSFYKFYQAWARQGGTILDIGVCISALEKVCVRNPAATIAQANQVLLLVPL